VILRRISEFSLDRFEVILVHFERALYFFVTCVVHLINDGSDKLKKKAVSTLVVFLESGILAQ
jgi:hypothetical protein